MSKKLNLEVFTNDVLNEAESVSQILRQGFAKISKDPRQRGQDIETELDLEVARRWYRFLVKRYPFIDLDTEEEETRINSGSEYTVRCDSIDGSKYVRSGIDIFGSTFALSRNNKVIFAMVLNPLSEKIYHAVKGRGALLNGRPIKVSDSSISEAFVFHESPTAKLYQKDQERYQKHVKIFNNLLPLVFRIRNFGLSSLPICWVAQGAAAAYLDLSGTTKLYDVEAAVFIAKQAGAKVSDLQGNKIDLEKSWAGLDKKFLTIDLLVANPKAHQEILELLCKQAELCL